MVGCIPPRRRPTRRPPYRLEPAPLGYGGFAKVTRGVHRETGEVAAVKQAFDAPVFRQRLRREIEVQIQIDHPNVMPIHEYHLGHEWYSMPLADEDLEHYRASPQWSLRTLPTVIREAWEGLKSAHQLGHVHRDVTPRNVLRIGGRWLISDFGLVTKGERESLESLTRTGAAVGTRGFIAPEVERDPATAPPSSDIYSLGRIVAWAVSGTWPASAALQEIPLGEWHDFVDAATRSADERYAAINHLAAIEYRARYERENSCLVCGQAAGFVGHGFFCANCGPERSWLLRRRSRRTRISTLPERGRHAAVRPDTSASAVATADRARIDWPQGPCKAAAAPTLDPHLRGASRRRQRVRR